MKKIINFIRGILHVASVRHCGLPTFQIHCYIKCRLVISVYIIFFTVI